jgi:hypothetical protein
MAVVGKLTNVVKRRQIMKRMMLIMIALVVIGSVAFAQSNQVLSRNAVGYVKVLAPRGGFTLVRNDFNALSGSLTPSNMFGNTTFPVGTRLYIWDNAGSTYNFEDLTSNGFTHVVAWSPNANTLDPGRGFWISVPGGAASNSYTAFMMGEVPDRNTAPTTSVTILTGFNMFGYPYPADVLWTDTQLAKSAEVNDTLYTWNGSGYSFNTLTSNGFTHIKKWDDTNQVLNVGQGYWFRRYGSGFTWNETKPYTWP